MSDAEPAAPPGDGVEIQMGEDGGHVVLATRVLDAKAAVALALGRVDGLGHDLAAVTSTAVAALGARPDRLTARATMVGLDDATASAIARGVRAAASDLGLELASFSVERRDGELPSLRVTGSCAGRAPPGRLADGAATRPGDVLIGVRASGLQAVGVGRAHRALVDVGGYDARQILRHSHESLADELLAPARPFWREFAYLLTNVRAIRAIVPVDATGWLALRRLPAPVGFEISFVPEPPPIQREAWRAGRLDGATMYGAFTMGVGFFVVVAPEATEAIFDALSANLLAAFRLGWATDDPARRVAIRPLRLRSDGSGFERVG